jgi:hypothetical protein
VLHAVGRPKHQKFVDDDDQPSSRCSFGFLKAGWFWAVVIVVTVICVSASNVYSTCFATVTAIHAKL